MSLIPNPASPPPHTIAYNSSNPNNFPIVDTGTKAEPAFVEKVKNQDTASLLGDLNDRRANFTDGQLSAMYSEIVTRAGNNKAGFGQQELYLLGMLKKGPLRTSDSNQLFSALPLDHNGTDSATFKNNPMLTAGSAPTVVFLRSIQHLQLNESQLALYKQMLLNRAAQTSGGVTQNEKNKIDEFMAKGKAGTLTDADVSIMLNMLPQYGDGKSAHSYRDAAIPGDGMV